MGCTQSNTALETAPASAPRSAAPRSAAPLSSAPKSASAASAIADAPTSDIPEASARQYLISGQSINEQGIVVYHIEARGVTIKKRFNEFKVFHQQLSTVTSVPALPEAGLFTAFQRKNDALIQARAARFREIINVAADQAPERLDTFVGVSVAPAPTSNVTIVEEIEVTVEANEVVVEETITEVAVTEETTVEEAVAEEAIVDDVVAEITAELEPEAEVADETPVEKSSVYEEKKVVVI
ncbi:hypothetical protein SDRG_14316 [Saprolegnia diclina VS20]|uniref:PX domain-containing protein n=1 Tax=Saprolegnia diclina (strain VS20) TaxID=1156394 RepID=T0Q3B4_SAPDV|nr:hypothetical protein SDRG_14316 [Saprolegnia diclina VS20]EQC27895.1 hypothetical protein SDRG_14316 [Saprolegnia diclina VS20]|eukprot:XP_008618660.1 hypothetical protein SDRG_14316 [Saprolegnia diclina VS20]